MEFADSKVRPGRETSLRLSASDSSSLCAIAVVDKSIELMGTTSQLTKSKVLIRMRRFSGILLNILRLSQIAYRLNYQC